MFFILGIFLGYLTYEGLKSFSEWIEDIEEKKRKLKYQEEKKKLKEFESKYQQSPNCSIINHGTFIAKSKKELDEYYKLMQGMQIL